MKVDRVIDTDVLVIGGGGAACRAALAAHDADAKTTLILKGELGKCGATVAPGSRVAWQASDGCSAPEDSPAIFVNNILEAGLGMADPRLSRILAYEVLDRMAELERWGLRFVPDPGPDKRHYTGYSCFADRPRAHCIQNTAGYGHAGDIVYVLERQIRQRDIELHEDVYAIDLLIDDGRCRGVIALGPDGQILAYRAGAVVLGTGGVSQVFPSSGRDIDTTGDGHAMALRAGAELTNVEFCQFMLSTRGMTTLRVPGSIWTAFPEVRNHAGEDVLTPLLPSGVDRKAVFYQRTLHSPFSSRDSSKWLDIAVSRARRENGEQDALIDFSGVDPSEYVPSRPLHCPSDTPQEVVLQDEPLLARDVSHAINGGVRIDERAESTVPGLFAAGEVAAGPHGADRLGGGMVTNCQVFGCRAGRYAAETARQVGPARLSARIVDRCVARLSRFGRSQQSAEDVFTALQAQTGRNLMVLRNRDGLLSVRATIARLRAEELPYLAVGATLSLRRALEAENTLLVADLMALAALTREESRGSHFREDYPEQDDDSWRVNVLLCATDGQIEVSLLSLASSDQPG